jgi:uncharacterized protein (DUF433 family)
MPEDRSYSHITLNPRGVPCLDGTRHRVIDLVADHVAHGDRAAHIGRAVSRPDAGPSPCRARV